MPPLRAATARHPLSLFDISLLFTHARAMEGRYTDRLSPSVRPSLCQCLFAHRRGIILSPNVEVSGWATAPCVSMSVSLSTKRLSTRWIENSWREVRSVTKFGRQNEVVLTLNPKRYGLRCFDYLASLLLFLLLRFASRSSNCVKEMAERVVERNLDLALLFLLLL